MRAARVIRRALALLLVVCPAMIAAQETRCDEGDTEVVQLSFQGNTAFTDPQLAQGIVTTSSTRVRRVTRIFGRRHCLNAEELPRDVLRLRLWYRNHGFLEATVDTVVAAAGRQKVEVRFVIVEGTPVRVDSVVIEGMDAVPERAALTADLPTRAGGLFDRYANAASRDSLTRRLRDNGYPEAEAFLGYDLHAQERRATVVFTVSPGRRRRIGRINITREGRDGGSPEVRTTAVRRLVGLEVGELYRERQLERAKRTLYQSEAFSQVVVEPGAFSEDSLMTVNVNVREGYLRAARLGGGWGSLDCFRMTGDLTEYNLLQSATRLELRGRVSKIGIGQPLGGAAGACPQAQEDIYSANLNYYLGATVSQPAVLRSAWVPTLSVYSERRSEYNAFLRTTPIGVGLNVSNTIAQRTRALGYTIELGRTEASAALFCGVFNACSEDDRSSLQSDRRIAVLSASQSIERTDNPIDPSEGFVARAEVRHASPPVGADRDINFTRTTIDGSSYIRVSEGVIFAARVRLGVVFGESFALQQGVTGFVPPQERLYAGGPTTVRGFRQNELGPSVYIPDTYALVRPGAPNTFVNEADVAAGDTVWARAFPDSTGQRAVPLGGNAMIIGNTEFRFDSPFLPDAIKWTLFADFGELWNRATSRGSLGFRAVKMTPGLGIRIRTPIGFVRADIAYNMYNASTGAAFFDRGQGLGGELWCVSPTNTFPVVREGTRLTQVTPEGPSGRPLSCPATYNPGYRRSIFGRWTPSFAIGQAF